MNDLFSEKIIDTFDFLFLDDDDSVIILSNVNKIIKLNDKAKKLFSCLKIDDITKKMDESSLVIWLQFLKDATRLNLATCQISLSHDFQGKMKFHVEGCFNQATLQYIIRFKQLAVEEEISNIELGGLVKYKSFFQYAPYGLVLTNKSGAIIEANQMVEAFLNISTQMIIGKSSQILFELIPDSKQMSKHFYKTLVAKGSAKMTLPVVDEEGEAKYFQVKTVFMKDVQMYLTIIRDDTETIQLKNQIDHSRSLTTLGQMAASIAHEIRNPMTSLKGFTQLLSHQVTQEGNQYLGIINSEISRMESILNEFLVLSKPTKRSFECFSLSSIITQVVEFMYPQGLLQGIQLSYVSMQQSADNINGDAYELKKVLMNILKNALEVMSSGGEITITQSLTENNQIRISVKDQGTGMSKDQMNKIFMPFYTSKEKGTGLGLAHAVQTIEEHGGCIEVESEVGHGTTFHLLLPVYVMDEMKNRSKDASSYVKL